MPLRNYAEIYQNINYSDQIKKLANAIIANNLINKMKIYKEISSKTTVPKEVVFIIHYLESNCNFNTHLHNGDSLFERTIHVPKGRPKNGNPPFSFIDSAIDALLMKRRMFPKQWDLNNTCEFLERYNGLGYYKLGVQSPYLLGNTNFHKKGKFISDGKYNPNATTKQIGAMVFIKELEQLKLLSIKLT